jgi:predicted regulator of Ras-like GTPase activity (Roadblock/LC7/MglB family)
MTTNNARSARIGALLGDVVREANARAAVLVDDAGTPVAQSCDPASAAKIAARLAEADCGATTGPLFHADLGGLIHVEPVEQHRLAVLFDARSSLVLVRLRTRKARGKLDEAIGAPNPEQAD